MKSNRTHFLTFLFLLFLCAGLSAQVTTSSLYGKVTDSGGESLIAASVIATHVPSGSQYGTTTREDGSYSLPNMRIGGPYTVMVNYLGYRDQEVTDIYLELAQKLEVDFTMEEETFTTETVTIVANVDAVMNSERTGAATNIGAERIERLPTITRSASDYYRLSPVSDGNSFAGRNDQFNNFTLDGSIFNNPFGLDAATPGGQTEAQPVSIDAIEEIQVSVAPYDVTQAGFTGAGVNAVTKSGTNTLHGTVFGFWRNQDLTGSKVSGTDIVVPELSQNQIGFSLGGPIIKNKLFFFANAELDNRTDAGSNFLAARSGLSGDNVSRVQAADLELVSSLLSSRYGYDTGPYEGFLHDQDSYKGIFKLDWNVSNQHKLTATYNFLDALKDKPAHPSAIGRRGPDATTLQFQNSGYRINNIIHSGIVELNSLFGNKFSNKLQVGYTSFVDRRDPFSDQFPVLNIGKDGIRYIVAGHEPFSIHNELDQTVTQITDNFNIYLTDHTITLGTSFEKFKFGNSFNLVGYGFRVFFPDIPIEDFEEFINSGAMDDEVDAARARNLEDDSEWALAETNVGQWAFYAQDEWNASDELRLTLGLRVDMPLYFDTQDNIIPNTDPITYFNEDGESVTVDNTKLPDQTPLFSPRIGFNYNVKGEGLTQIRGGSGLFSGRLPFVWIGNQVANPFSGFLNVTAEDFKFPQVWRSNIGIDHRLESNWTLSADFIYTKDVNGVMVRNYALGTPGATLQGVDNRPIYRYGTDVVINPGDAFGGPALNYVFTNVDIGRSINFTLQAQKQFDNGLYTSLAYNYLDSKDASSIEAEISSDAFDRNPSFGNTNEAKLAPSIYGNKHRIVGVASKKWKYSGGKLATTVSVFTEYAQGGRYSYTYSGDLNGDTSPLNDLLYIPTDSEIDQMQFAGDAGAQQNQRAALKAFIAQDSYLNDRRGEYAEKYGILSPWYNHWDVRILQDFNLDVGDRTNTIQFSWDILNIGNLISGGNWGVRQFPTNSQPIGVSVDGGVPTYSFDTSLTESFTNDFSLLSRWQMNFGLRYIF